MGGRDIWPKPPAPGWGRANEKGGGGGEIEGEKGRRRQSSGVRKVHTYVHITTKST